MGQDIAERVRHVIRHQLDVEEARITPTASFIDDLKADSLGLVELTLAFEAEFDIDIADEDVEWIHTVQDAITYVERHTKERDTPSRAPEP